MFRVSTVTGERHTLDYCMFLFFSFTQRVGGRMDGDGSDDDDSLHRALGILCRVRFDGSLSSFSRD